MPLNIIRNDITAMEVDAIVNAANTELKMGGGVCGAIFKKAGQEKLKDACNKLGSIKTGEAVITSGFDLAAKFIIHTAGPVYKDGMQGEEELLRAAYVNSLRLATENGCESIAFPLISSGIYGYPKTEALRVATEAIRDYILENDMNVSLVMFDKSAFEISQNLLGSVASFIDQHYVDEQVDLLRTRRANAKLKDIYAEESSEKILRSYKMIPTSLEKKIDELDESFSTTLLRLIDASGKRDAEIYNRANIDRRLFSKIRSNVAYMPSKPTVFAFAIALELDLEQTEGLLEKAGFAISRSRKFDVIIEYFIQKKRYDIFEINNVLFEYDQQLLGG